MDPSPPPAPPRAVIISGITVRLDERLKHSLHLNLSIDGVDSHSVLLKRNEKPAGVQSFPSCLHLRDGSTLSVQVQEKHRVQRDKCLVQLNLSVKNFWEVQGLSAPDTHVKKYEIRLPDPSQKIWLNVSTVPSSPPTSAHNVGQSSEVKTTEGVLDNRRAANALKDAIQSLQNFKTIFEQLGGAKLEKGMKVAEAIGELHSTVKVVIKLVKIVHDEFKIHDQHHKDLLDLAKCMKRTLKFIPAAEEVAKLNALKDTIPSFYELMNETVEFIKNWLAEGGISKIVNNFDSQSEIESLTKQYHAFEKEFNLGVAVDNAVKIDYVATSQELQQLQAGLGCIKEVRPRADPCMEGTRINILSNVESKINDLEGKNIVWVHGAPGSGKSAVSLTIKSRLHEYGRLVTYFRFDRNEATVTTSSALWCHVAYDIAKQYPSVLHHHLSLLQNNKVNLTSTADLFKSLVEEPLSTLIDPLPDHPLVIVIDALDECGGFVGRSSTDRQAFLQTLVRWSQLPRHFKLLVTSRDESDISRVLTSISTAIDIPSGNFLTDNPQTTSSIEASEDVRAFLKNRFQRITERLPLLGLGWPGNKTITDMVNQAAGNFMWATTASNFIDSGLNPQDRLDRIMGQAPQSSSNAGSSMKPLYSLYSTILETSFGRIGEDDPESEALRVILSTIVCAKRTLSDDEYTKLPIPSPICPIILQAVRDGLGSVLGVGDNLRFVHKSFDDFLLSNECPPKYAINMDKSQRLLTELCLTTMAAELRFNMCGLETSCLKNADVPEIETKVRDGISSLLSYSCCFWADHLGRTPFDEQLTSAVKKIIFDKLLYWFEAMSLLTEINQVSNSLLSVLNWVKPISDEELNGFIRDAHWFVRAFGQPISQSAPHIYISALPFAPEFSPIARQYLSQFPWILKVSVGKPKDWSPCVFAREHHDDQVTSVTFSPDGKHFASGSSNGTICLCDSETGNLIAGPFISPVGGSVKTCFFDPNDRQVWANYQTSPNTYGPEERSPVIGWNIQSGDKHVCFQVGEGSVRVGYCSSNGGQNIAAITLQGSVILWNADTGEQFHGLLKLPSDDNYRRISISPDGSYVAWGGGDDKTIKIWNLANGSEIFCSQSHTILPEHITCLSFSVDGHFLVSGSMEGTILIWDVKTGNLAGLPLTTGKGRVYEVAYSHEGKVLLSLFLGTLMVWNTSTHETVLGPLKCDTPIIALSRDGKRALSVSPRSTVRMWDLGRKGVMSTIHPIEGHTSQVRCVTFSPCGKKLASLDKSGTIRVWDANSGKPLLKPISTNPNCSKIIFSPDGSHILAAGDTLQAWNVKTGELTFECRLSDDNGEYVWHIAVRSTDQRLVTCSSRRVIRIWSMEDGSQLPTSSPQPEDPNTPVWILALSPDGLTAIVRDYKRSPKCYLWSTTTCQPLPFTFTDDLSSVAYSASGKFFGTVSARTLRVWNVLTGELVLGPSTLDDWVKCLAFSPNECHIALSYALDSTAITIFNTHTSCPVSGPRKAHTDDIALLTFSPDGTTLVSGSRGGQIAIWNIADVLGCPRASTGLLRPGMRMRDGWVMDADGNFLFWVPTDHRSAFVWSRNIGIIIGGHGIRTELDLARFRYGLNWEECAGGEKETAN